MIDVAAAIIEADGKFLAARRAPGQHLAGFWEFPGGKVEPGESTEVCLARELNEEFGITVTVGQKLGENIHHYGDKVIRLIAHRVHDHKGDLKLQDHDEVRWLSIDQLSSVEWAPADVPIVQRLKIDYQQSSTRAFYESNAARYVQTTASVDMGDEYHRFLKHMPKGGAILDLGCGSGRDSRYFLDRGYRVTALDSCEALGKLASERIRQAVVIRSYLEIDYEHEFDGVWANASLVHCPKTSIANVLARVVAALKSSGTLYMSFKLGNRERVDEDGRFFSDYEEAELQNFCKDQPSLVDVSTWTSPSRVPGSGDTWLNCLATKR